MPVRGRAEPDRRHSYRSGRLRTVGVVLAAALASVAVLAPPASAEGDVRYWAGAVGFLQVQCAHGSVYSRVPSTTRFGVRTSTMTKQGGYPNCDEPLGRPYAQVRAYTIWQEYVAGAWVNIPTGGNAYNAAGSPHATTGWWDLIVTPGTYRAVGVHSAYVGGATRSPLTLTVAYTYL